LRHCYVSTALTANVGIYGFKGDGELETAVNRGLKTRLTELQLYFDDLINISVMPEIT
jgi:hypothetical protein